MSLRDRFKSNNIQNLTKQVEELNKTQSYKDDRFWQAERDNEGNGYAIIRFLPPTNPDNDAPFVRYWRHGFQGPTGRWYIENSRTSLGENDPVTDYTSPLWNNDPTEAQKKELRKFNRKLTYVSNILVIKDPANPQNEGKVFMFAYGKKIFDKINEAMTPQFGDETPVNPFDPWDGANFRLKIRKVAGYANYDRSEFEQPSALFGGNESQIETVWKQQYDLNEFIDPKNYKSYDELKQQLDSVLNSDHTESNAATAEEASFTSSPRKSERVSGDLDSDSDNEAPPFETADSGDALSFFEGLAEED